MSRSPRVVSGLSPRRSLDPRTRLRAGGASARQACRNCQAHRARFRYRGRVRADRDHTLCFRCFRAEVNRLRARHLCGVRL
jgi:hypothetical protein